MKCRFAPSPTGKIHIGNARSAILNWVFCKKNNGEFVLRIDDTDVSRSLKEFEEGIKSDLKWLGVNWNYTFNQSTRSNIYNKKIQTLKDKNRLYPCFETEEELALKKKSLLSSGKPPIYDRSSLKLSNEEIEKKIRLGIKPHWRFKLNNEIITWNDIIKGTVSFDTKNLSDPILIRADGSLLYHLPSVIDDIEEDITHIIRGEDHIANTAYHIQIFKALDSPCPIFAHHPFLVDELGKGFSKRLGSLSIENFRNEGYENITLLNFFLFLGSSNNIDPIKEVNEIINKFEIKNLSKSSAKFSIESLKNLNQNTIKLFNYEEVKEKLKNIKTEFYNENFWLFIRNNIAFLKDAEEWQELISKIINFKEFDIDEDFINVAIDELPDDPYDETTWDNWTSKIKNRTGLKGKNLFMPLRLVLTGKSHGPELKNLLPLFNKNGILQKLGKI